MTEINGSQLLNFVDEAIGSTEGGWDALFALNELISEEEEFRAALAA